MPNQTLPLDQIHPSDQTQHPQCCTYLRNVTLDCSLATRRSTVATSPDFLGLGSRALGISEPEVLWAITNPLALGLSQVSLREFAWLQVVRTMHRRRVHLLRTHLVVRVDRILEIARCEAREPCFCRHLARHRFRQTQRAKAQTARFRQRR
jgi:hypothetical protein